ncbi:hypothetical protein [Pseudooctadecabacter sp.]|uniref:hypothetical protein n=1 Tax=Pseudooctadecabacter sp. TaxID=1966338 RepID=UPI0035C834DC
MNELPLIWLLPIATFVLVIVFALWSRKRTQDIRHTRTSEKSSLASDGPGPNPFGPDK